MTGSSSSSSEPVECSKRATPVAQKLQALRDQVCDSTPGPGAITKVAQEVQMSRSTLNRIIAPATIDKIEELEKHLGDV